MHGFYIVIILSTWGLIKQTYEVLIKNKFASTCITTYLEIIARVIYDMEIYCTLWKTKNKFVNFNLF